MRWYPFWGHRSQAANKQWSIWGISMKFGNGLGWCHVMTPGLVDACIFVSDVSGHGHTAPMPSRCPPRPAKWWSLRPWRGLRGWTFPRPDVAGLPAKGWQAWPISCRRSTIWEKHHGKNNGKTRSDVVLKDWKSSSSAKRCTNSPVLRRIVPSCSTATSFFQTNAGCFRSCCDST